MNPKITLCFVLGILFVVGHQAWAFSEGYDIKPDQLRTGSPILAVKVNNENGSKHFHVIVDPEDRTHGAGEILVDNMSSLQVYDGSKVVSGRKVASHKLAAKTQNINATQQDRAVDFDFILTTNDLAKSKFVTYFVISYSNTNGPGFDDLRCYMNLKDFMDEK